MTARPVMVIVAALLLAVAARASLADDAQGLRALHRQAEQWQRQGEDEPAAVMAVIDRALAEPTLPAVRQRLLQRVRGVVAARGGLDTEVDRAVRALDALAGAGQPLARADAEVVLAVHERQQGRSEGSADHARRAADVYAVACGSGPTVPEGCDPGAFWLALDLLQRGPEGEVDPARALAMGEAASAQAQRIGDLALQALSESAQATFLARQGHGARAMQQLARAQALVRELGRPDIEAAVAMRRLQVGKVLGDVSAMDRGLTQALDAARRARSPRLMAFVQAGRSDVLLLRHRAAEAVNAVRAAMPVALRFNDRRLERVLLHNGTLAHIELGHTADARVQAKRLFELWVAEGTPGQQSTALREVSDALAAAGEGPLALELYHREQAITTRLLSAQREAAERDLRARYDRDAQQRAIELKARDNAVQAAELYNRQLLQRVWALAAVVVGLGALLVGLLLKRVRGTQQALRRSQQQLKVQSERDPLTGVTNRRQGQALLQAHSAGHGGTCRGALLLVDVDHFKRINDDHGHPVGDQVLVEIARRLQSAVREDDVVVRWGGEEFLIVAPAARAEALDALAQRLLSAVGGAPVALAEGGAIPVTASVGYGAFPLEPNGEAVGWERALNLVDMALYTAKSLGRHRAVGVLALSDEAQNLTEIERDFERAWGEGKVRLAIQVGD